MLKLHHHFGQTLVFTACFIAAVGCDSLERVTPRNIDNMSEKDPILGFASNGNPESDVDVRRRLIDSYVEYWPLISSEDQHKRLPKVLNDPIPELKAFGVERVAILLRDGEALEEELWLVVTLIKDEYPKVQMAAAKLLLEINDVDLFEQSDGTTIGLSEFVALALETEERQSIAALELAFFQTRPHPDAVEPSISRLQSGPVGPAAKTLFALLNADMVSDDQKNRIFKHVQRSHRSISKLPSLITLNAMLGALLGDTKVQEELIHLLRESPDKSILMAVAQGFASAGFGVLDIDLQALALVTLRERGGIDSIQVLIALDAEDHPDRDAAVFAIAIKLGITSLIDVDDMLKDRDMNTLRLSILQSGWQSIWGDSSTTSPPERFAIAIRAVPLFIETGDASGALPFLDKFGDTLKEYPEDQQEVLLTLKFNAAIAASAWDDAAVIRTKPEPWIKAWELEADPNGANAILKQINLRFQDELSASEKELLGTVDVDASPDQNP